MAKVEEIQCSRGHTISVLFVVEVQLVSCFISYLFFLFLISIPWCSLLTSHVAQTDGFVQVDFFIIIIFNSSVSKCLKDSWEAAELQKWDSVCFQFLKLSVFFL